MSGAAVEQVASALLYEGYLLYPYRRSAVKNRQRFNFGVIYPEAHARAEAGDAGEMRTECLIQGDADARLDVSVRFLHLFVRTPEQPGEPAWHDAIERSITVPGVALRDLAATPRSVAFGFPAAAQPGRQLGLTGRVELGVEAAGDAVWRVRVTDPERDAPGRGALVRSRRAAAPLAGLGPHDPPSRRRRLRQPDRSTRGAPARRRGLPQPRHLAGARRGGRFALDDAVLAHHRGRLPDGRPRKPG